jgi:hypothetical protein
MRKLIVLAVAGSLAAPVAANAAKPRSYANCTALNSHYPHGVGKRHAHDHVRGSTAPVTTFKRSNKLYRLNSQMDRDGDGVACEKP